MRKETNFIPYAKFEDGDFFVAEEERSYNIDRDGNEYLLITRFYALRGTLKYIKKYGKTRCRCYKSLDALIADDKDVFKNNKKIVEWLM